MSDFRINFFTATCLNWQHLLETDAHKMIIIDSLKYLTLENKIWLYSYVIMPNHIHLIWRKQELWLDKNIQLQFLRFTAQKIKFNLLDTKSIELNNFLSTQNDRNYQFWERRPYSAKMHERKVVEQKLNYIHLNPVKKNLVIDPNEYRFSSSKFYNEKGDEFGILTDYREHI